MEVLTTHYSPKPTEVMQRFRFNSRARKEGESVADYIAELRKLAEFCNYGAALDKMLRDRLVWGVRDTHIQKKVLSEQNLTLAKAVQVALSAEAAEKNLREMDVGETPRYEPAVHYIPKPVQDSIMCSRGGKRNHRGSDCPYKDFVCRGCHRVGHLQKMCRSAGGRTNPEKTLRGDRQQQCAARGT